MKIEDLELKVDLYLSLLTTPIEQLSKEEQAIMVLLASDEDIKNLPSFETKLKIMEDKAEYKVKVAIKKANESYVVLKSFTSESNKTEEMLSVTLEMDYINNAFIIKPTGNNPCLFNFTCKNRGDNPINAALKFAELGKLITEASLLAEKLFKEYKQNNS